MLKTKSEQEKWNVEQKKQLINAVEKHGENWDEVVKVYIINKRCLMVQNLNKNA